MSNANSERISIGACGLARGIDTAAYRATLDAGGCTIAVLESGLDVIYPVENRQLVNQIVEEDRGTVVSEYALGTQPDAMTFRHATESSA